MSEITPAERKLLQQLGAAVTQSREREEDLRRYYDAAQKIYDEHPEDPEAQLFFNQADALYKHGQSGG
jgi:hypothetical protein